MGMAFVDALVDHADVRVALVDRRHGVGGHWLEAYPFVRLHQASAFYGVASTLLGGGRLQQRGPEAGLQERATQSEVCAYYARVLDRLVESGKVEFFPNSEYAATAPSSRASPGERFEVPERCRIVDARYLAPEHPRREAAALRRRRGRPGGAGQRSRPARGGAEPVRRRRARARPRPTPASGCSSRGVDPDAICWVRPRDPWMMNRAWSSQIPRSSSAWPPTRCRQPRRRLRSTTCSSASRTPASCCGSTAR